MKFAVKTVTCLGCRTPLKPNSLSEPPTDTARGSVTDTETVSGADQAVCNNCRPRTAELHAKQVSIAAQAETAYARLWTQCQRCQGSLHQVRACASLTSGKAGLTSASHLLENRTFCARQRTARSSTCARRLRRRLSTPSGRSSAVSPARLPPADTTS